MNCVHLMIHRKLLISGNYFQCLGPYGGGSYTSPSGASVKLKHVAFKEGFRVEIWTFENIKRGENPSGRCKSHF